MPAPVLSLRPIRARDTVHRFQLLADEVLLGRDPVCDVVVGHPAISRRHLRIRLLGGAVHVTALAHGARVLGIELEPGVEVLFPFTPIVLIGEFYVWLDGRPEPNV